LFPIGIDDFPGSIQFHDVADDRFTIGEVEVTSRLVPHLGNTCGYRLEWNGASLAYISDHQQTGTDRFQATDGARELCRDVDVLIHDSQYTAEEFEAKATWGHCTVEYAVWLAEECGVKTLVLYHHDPLHDDDQVDGFVAAARERGARSGLQVVGAREGATVHVGS
jgi:ribonuclease BN (tRNA processing enzyme)